MEEDQNMSAKEVMEGVRAINELLGAFKGCRNTVAAMMPHFIQAAQGDGASWFKGMEEVSRLDVDEAQGCLIVALTNIGSIRAKIKGTPAEDILREIFTPKES